jgi:hypothetical protein
MVNKTMSTVSITATAEPYPNLAVYRLLVYLQVRTSVVNPASVGHDEDEVKVLKLPMVEMTRLKTMAASARHRDMGQPLQVGGPVYLCGLVVLLGYSSARRERKS